MPAASSENLPERRATGSVWTLLALGDRCRNVSGNDWLLLSFEILTGARSTVIFCDRWGQFLAGEGEFGNYSMKVLNN
jgi:hypothetical protein